LRQLIASDDQHRNFLEGVISFFILWGGGPGPSPVKTADLLCFLKAAGRCKSSASASWSPFLLSGRMMFALMFPVIAFWEGWVLVN